MFVHTPSLGLCSQHHHRCRRCRARRHNPPPTTRNKQEAELKGHSKKLTSVKFHPDASRDMIFTTSADKTAKFWSKSGKVSHHAGLSTVARKWGVYYHTTAASSIHFDSYGGNYHLFHFSPRLLVSSDDSNPFEFSLSFSLWIFTTTTTLTKSTPHLHSQPCFTGLR